MTAPEMSSSLKLEPYLTPLTIPALLSELPYQGLSLGLVSAPPHEEREDQRRLQATKQTWLRVAVYGITSRWGHRMDQRLESDWGTAGPAGYSIGHQSPLSGAGLSPLWNGVDVIA